MEEITEKGMPVHLANMSLATTPHHSFESADRMLVQAATIRECAEELQAKIQDLYSKADALELTAQNIQRQGTQHRQETAEALEKVLDQYKHILPQFDAVKPLSLEKLALAVEEGRALTEQVENFEQQLRAFSETLYHDNGPTSKSARDLEDESRPNGEHNSPSSAGRVILFPSSSSDDFYPVTDAPDTYNHTSNDVDTTIRKRKFDSEAECSLSKDDEMANPGRKKRQRKNREQRKKSVLASMGYDSEEISEIDLQNLIVTPKRSKSKGRVRTHKHRMNNIVSLKPEVCSTIEVGNNGSE